MRTAIVQVARYRDVNLAPLSQVLDGYAAAAQQRWVAWRRKHRLDDRLPQDFAAVLETVTTFADPVLTGRIDGQIWSAAHVSWAPIRR